MSAFLNYLALLWFCTTRVFVLSIVYNRFHTLSHILKTISIAFVSAYFTPVWAGLESQRIKINIS